MIHPTAIIHSSAHIGKNCYIGPYTVIGADVFIHDNVHIEAHASIGQPAEKHGFLHGEDSPGVVIHEGCVIREFCTINAGTFRKTTLGPHSIMLRGSHLSHDSITEDHVNISCNVLIGGESYIGGYANLGLGSILHQRSIIGGLAMLGMGTVVTKSSQILPMHVYVGSPARELKRNSIGVERSGLSQAELNELILDYNERVNLKV